MLTIARVLSSSIDSAANHRSRTNTTMHKLKIKTDSPISRQCACGRLALFSAETSSNLDT
jgi:hypothetical protein